MVTKIFKSKYRYTVHLAPYVVNENKYSFNPKYSTITLISSYNK